MTKLFDEVLSERGQPPATPPKPAEKVEALDEAPRKWRFTVKRDDNGRLSEILAEVVE